MDPLKYDDSGLLFQNDRREKDTQPNLTGRINIGGVEYWLSAWTKKAENGNKFLSLAVGDEIDYSQVHTRKPVGAPKTRARGAASNKPNTRTKRNRDGFDDDIPF